MPRHEGRIDLAFGLCVGPCDGLVMRLVLLTLLTMMTFSGNSVLTRAGVTTGGLDPLSFGVVRMAAGAAMLAVLCAVFRGGLRLGGAGRGIGVFSLLLYLIGFSAAYIALDSGVGALVLFGMVQITMFGAALLVRETLPPRRWLGAGLAMLGLVWLLWPTGAAAISVPHGLMMAVAGVGWGLYSLAGRKEPDALQATAANFIVGSGVIIAGGLLYTQGGLWRVVTQEASATGLWLAVASGALTSGLGYALWYSILPRIPGTVAAVAQLSVPVFAMAGGMIWLGENLTVRFVLASALVLGGVVVSVSAGQGGKRRSSGS